MPIYEYHCNECDADFETLVLKFEENNVNPCPKCGSKETKKLFSAFAKSNQSGNCSPPSKKFR